MTALARALALAALACVAPASAQSARDFATFDLAVGGAGQVGASWDGRWEASPALGARLETPVGGGYLAFGARGWGNTGVDDLVPNFTALQASAGWGPSVTFGPASLRSSAHVGAIAFLFDDEDDFTGALRRETELAAGVSGRVIVGVRRGFAAWAGADAVHVFTEPSERMLFLEAGVAISVGAPAWLGRALR